MRVAGFNRLVPHKARTFEGAPGLQGASLRAVLGESDSVQCALTTAG
ncbi:hypothetical protein LILAB_26335 [Corallococcus macrosporus]|uniref:Uncharacterized protein n=1 Tax=Myxococcus fulvus (strain ATCC BAA-855 / HW-1) TaxID=483219 RepID=F8CAV7_MYXFH|nr:hypothetical protein LILAB_26335 [Corallococcus macrosporus]